MTDYQKQAEDFLAKHNATMTAVKLFTGPYSDDDNDVRDVYQITLTREGKKPYIFKFGQSIAHSEASINAETDKIKFKSFHLSPKAIAEIKVLKAKLIPTAYDVLACLQKHDVGTFEDFCCDFGYDIDSRKALKTYLAVQDEAANVQRLFGDCIDELEEIQ